MEKGICQDCEFGEIVPSITGCVACTFDNYCILLHKFFYSCDDYEYKEDNNGDS